MYVQPDAGQSRPVTVTALRAMKQRREPIVALTAYDTASPCCSTRPVST